MDPRLYTTNPILGTGGVPPRATGRARGYNDKRGAGLPSDKFHQDAWSPTPRQRSAAEVKVMGYSRNPLLEGEVPARPSKSYAAAKVWGTGRNPIVEGDPCYQPPRAPTRGTKFLTEGTSPEYDLYPTTGGSGRSSGRRHVVDPNRHNGSSSLAHIGGSPEQQPVRRAHPKHHADTSGLIGGINAPPVIDADRAAEHAAHEAAIAAEAANNATYQQNRQVYSRLRHACTATNPDLLSFDYPQ
ncbi:uncharacterized protein AMSG_01409 [Thecamonas trahens ATCC 50062]|uniref:Uncharacterized protein n=1 Tax=Thecamonas trahens ATCC 50062 TaxID=461836 RepID=A0A0L0DQJ5_THETB|nr:hypothetical protein AMSG_01409 [Thecamonas trahens ATCC 50062]KNC53698.1 hypothetical protein AMSG_01409 [Thecamonas trahens ATCC 50062]|eukprot:XP_013762012.1 hypothetical protein AMSG_01409 [Thecamonas trahens ATCC 50062]